MNKIELGSSPQNGQSSGAGRHVTEAEKINAVHRGKCSSLSPPPLPLQGGFSLNSGDGNAVIVRSVYKCS